MADGKKPTAAQIERFVKEFGQIRPAYKELGGLLKEVFEAACEKANIPAVVQNRAKDLASFAEKCARKWEKYQPNPVKQMTDLCGVRLIVQTLDQVQAARQFVNQHFHCDEAEDKTALLGEREFGYRDMHYLIRLSPERSKCLRGKEGRPVTAGEIEKYKGLVAELQIRTWAEHAWADTLHDRMYKTPMAYTAEMKRISSLLGAIMEDGDRNFNTLVAEVDYLMANYSSTATREQVDAEIEIQRIAYNHSDVTRKPRMALILGRLYAIRNQYDEVIELLKEFGDVKAAGLCEQRGELGQAYFMRYRRAKDAQDLNRARELLSSAASDCAVCANCHCVKDMAKQNARRARALVRLARTYHHDPDEARKAVTYLQQAVTIEPRNPYCLSQLLAEPQFANADTPVNCPVSVLELARNACREHALAGTQMPYACFTAGRFSVVMSASRPQGQQQMETDSQALQYYACGIAHVLGGRHYTAATALEDEMKWLTDIHRDREPSQIQRQCKELLALALKVRPVKKSDDPHAAPQSPRALIIGGAAGSANEVPKETWQKVKTSLKDALGVFEGKVVYGGGSTAGICGVLGRTVGGLREAKKVSYALIGYLPGGNARDAGVVEDKKNYQIRYHGEGACSADQILQNWRDIMEGDGLTPQDVLVLGFGGGPISAAEYAIATALGATVGVIPLKEAVVGGTADAAGAIVADPLWRKAMNLMPVPLEPATLRALVLPGQSDRLAANDLEMIAQAFHEAYIETSAKNRPAGQQPWGKLENTYRKANYAQARYCFRILEAMGLAIRRHRGKGKVRVLDYSKYVEQMARLEHGRWNIERMQDGWRFSEKRDDEKKLHPNITVWEKVPVKIRDYDVQAVKAFGKILAKGGYEIYRP